MREQLHDGVRQAGPARVPGRAGRRAELRDLPGVLGEPEAQLAVRPGDGPGAARRGRLHAAGRADRQAAERLRGEHRVPRQAGEPDQPDGPVRGRQHTRADTAVLQDE